MAAIKGNLDPAPKALWDIVEAKWAAPGMNNPNDPHSPQGSALKVDPDPLRAAAERDTRDAGERNHDAFRCLLEMVVGQGKLGMHRGLPARVIVPMTLEQLESETGLATTASGGVIPVRDALALAGATRKFLALLDNKHRPLFLGVRPGWRQRGTADPLQPNNTHFSDKYFTHPEMWHPDSDADAQSFRQRAREELERLNPEPVIRTIDFGWPKPVAA